MLTICLFFLLQVITEFLPISSSGHLKLAECFSSSYILNEMTEFLFHGPTLLVLAIFFRNDWTFLIFNFMRFQKFLLHLLVCGIAAEVPTILFYYFFKFYNIRIFPLWLGFLITGILLISLKFRSFFVKSETGTITPIKAFIIGIAQGIALIPGISRFASTYVMGCWLGLHPKVSFIFSFTIAWPLMFAGFIKGLYEFYSLNNHLILSSTNFMTIFCIIIGILLSFCTLYLSYRLAMARKFWYFGVYMIVPTILAFLCI